MIVLDTNILSYAVGRDHPLREPCRAMMDAVAEGRVAATTTPEVIQEFLHVRAMSRGRSDAAQAAARFVEMLSPLWPSDEAALVSGLRIYQRHAEIGAFDAVLAAVAVARDAQALVSADRAFEGVREVLWIAPGTAAFDDLIAS